MKRKTLDSRTELPTKRVALTVAQQISIDAPHHPQAKHGIKEIEKKDEVKHEESLFKLSKLSTTIVDNWMKDMLAASTKDADESEAYYVSEELLTRQPR